MKTFTEEELINLGRAKDLVKRVDQLDENSTATFAIVAKEFQTTAQVVYSLYLRKLLGAL